MIFGDDATLQYAVTQTTDTLLMIPMTYAAVTGILSYRRMVFANRVLLLIVVYPVFLTMLWKLKFEE